MNSSNRRLPNIKTLLLFLFFLTIPLSTFAEAPQFLLKSSQSGEGDRWLGKDKFYHFTVSMGLAFGSFYVYREQLHNEERGSYCFSGGFTLSLGALKEYYDAKHPQKHTASWKDFTADAVGMAAGLGLSYLCFK
jgi:uncharacterized protein YfiM (DUF2279 family)